MRWRGSSVRTGAMACFVLCLWILIGALLAVDGCAAQVTLVVEGADGGAVGDYRWLLEEDLTFHPNIATPDPTDTNVLGLNFHRSYMPVVSKGESTTSSTTLRGLSRSGHYFVSVLPKTPGSYAMGGAPILPGQTSVTVTLNKQPLPTAQISVFVFEDKQRINGVPDLPQERGLEGFIVNISEPGGRYGAAGGQVSQDAFGNPLGTTYNPDGSVAVRGDGVIRTNADGVAIIKYLYPAKYGITVSPPLETPADVWYQTSTIEGTPTIDAWVKANEPPYFTEFGPAGHHADFGFVRRMNDTSVLSGGVTISGRVVSNHMSRPPDYTFNAGAPFSEAWVGLNDAGGRGVYAEPCNGDSTFAIPNVPPGNYQLVIWDKPLDIVFASTSVTVNADGTCGPLNGPLMGSCDLGDVAVFDWNGRLQGVVFQDLNRNGYRDPGEPGLPHQVLNIRWRDGTLYNTTTTDNSGEYAFTEVFPFFNWLVAEGASISQKATGVTVVADGGGAVDRTNTDFPGFGRLSPQPQRRVNRHTGDNLSRTERGEVNTEVFQLFLGQTNVIDWGKANYGPGPDGVFGTADDETGGISGVVYYDSTRAENNPALNVAEPWQPGIPNVTVRLWGAGPDGRLRTSDDVLLNQVLTDSWDASQPTGCPSPNATDPFTTLLGNKCYDGLRNFNQVRPGVYDGGYAFTSYWLPAFGAPGAVEVEGLPAGEYIVDVIPPRGYHVVRSQDKNVDFGDEYTPGLLALPPQCEGGRYAVPEFLSLFPGVLNPYYDPDSPAFVRAYDPASPIRLKSCDRKRIQVTAGLNAPADFFLFTEVPVAGHIVGMILNDLANEFDPNNPNFGEKFAPSWVPVSISDYTGREITRVYSDQYGNYNALVPSSYSANVPSPSGFAPNMLIACMNDPGPIPDPNHPGQFIIDPYFQRQYTQFCYTFQYMPGVTTYLDTPVLPIAAFAGQNQFPLDCEFPDETPVIFSVSDQANGFGGGPYVRASGGVLTITSMGPTQVPNPEFSFASGAPQKITRDYGFGTVPGQVTLGGVPLEIQRWSDGVIRAVVPAGTASGQLLVTRFDSGATTIMGVAVTVESTVPRNVWQVRPARMIGRTPITNAIARSAPGDLILVAPGVYDELVIMEKDVQLQGWGAPAVTINAVKRPGEKLQAWRERVNRIVAGDATGATRFLLPGQVANFNAANNEPGLLNTAEGPGILVLADFLSWQRASGVPKPRIDGITITGSDIGGAIVINGYARNLEISNNRMISNHGLLAGGIRIGDPQLLNGNDVPVNARNNNLKIHHNHITQNGSTGGGGGGIALFSGANGYEVSDNYICGNFTTGTGGGICHRGLSESARGPNLIARNTILFNQTFNQTPASVAEGAGISIEGILPLAGTGLTQGTGDVTVNANLIQGNLAGSGDGGGIRVAYANGDDAAANPTRRSSWHVIDIFNNMIVNNLAGLAGGGIVLKDALAVRIMQNTIANNDSTATAGDAFAAGPLNPSTPQPAGIVSRGHSPALAAIVGPGFSDPALANNIIWHNRSFHWDATLTNAAGIAVGGLLPAPDPYQDLAVLGAGGAATLDPRSCILTNTTGYAASNIVADPLFIAGYFNGNANLPVVPENTTPLTSAAVDEGGNFIDVRFGPLTPRNPATGALYGDYHIQAGSSAVNAGSGAVPGRSALLAADHDGNPRPAGPRPDIGADELSAAAAADIVSIRRAILRSSALPQLQLLIVQAASSAPGGSVNLRVSTDTGVSAAMSYQPAAGEYVARLVIVGAVPVSATVTSSGGGADTKQVPFPVP